MRTPPTVIIRVLAPLAPLCSPSASGSMFRRSWRELFRSSGQKGRKFCPAHDALRSGEAVPDARGRFRLYDPPLREIAPRHLRAYAQAVQEINQLIAGVVA
jgi:glyoxylase-like metal-dependent hydrolase (beta-lactamase superfamily II)